MKSIKFLNSLFAAVLFIIVYGIVFAVVLDVKVAATITSLAVLTVLATVAGRYYKSWKPKGALFESVYREVWTGEVEKQLSKLEVDTFLDGIPDYSRHVAPVGDEAQAIHLVYMGVEPDVLINNTTYPIPEQELGEDDIVIKLDKYQTKVTPVTDDELYALSYKKIAEVSASHGTAIMKAKLKKSIHAIAPGSNTADMPVLLTTGEDDGTGRRMLTPDDLVSFKRKIDNLLHDEMNRRLVLCDDHENDLLSLDQKFKDQYYNGDTGKLFKRFGFEFRSYLGNPYFTAATKTKKSFGSVPGAGDFKGSIYFMPRRMSKAVGWTKFYFNEAVTNPGTQRNTMNYRHYYITLPKREDARGAIVSDSAL